MNYRDYLASLLTWATVTTDVDYRRQEDEHVVIIKEIMGNNYRDTVVKSILLEVHTTDVVATKSLLETFSATYNDTSYTDDFDYVRQFYNTPMVLTNFQFSGENYSSIINVSGTLIISSNISDIKTVLIDGESYETYKRMITFSSVIDNQAPDMTGYINESEVRNGVLKASFNLISRGDSITHKLRSIRRGELPINTTFSIGLIYTDNDDVENYTMRCESHTVDSNNSSLPVLTISFIK